MEDRAAHHVLAQLYLRSHCQGETKLFGKPAIQQRKSNAIREPYIGRWAAIYNGAMDIAAFSKADETATRLKQPQAACGPHGDYTKGRGF